MKTEGPPSPGPSPAPRDLSLVILTKNSGELFGDVLRGLFACEGIDEAQLLCIDSGSTDGTLERLAEYRAIHVERIPPESFGHGRTRNLGASLTDRPFVGFLVHDATPAGPDFLRRLLEPLGDPSIAGSYARQRARMDATAVERFFLDDTYGPASRVQRWPEGREPTIHDTFFSNVASIVRRSVWERIPFREDVVMSEDAFWCHSALKAGYRVAYAAAAVVWHSHSYSLGNVFRRNFDTGAGVGEQIAGRPRDMIAYEVGYLRRGVRHLLGARESAQVPYFITHEAIRTLGVALGRHWRWLPRPLLRRLSLHAYHWADKGVKPSGG